MKLALFISLFYTGLQLTQSGTFSLKNEGFRSEEKCGYESCNLGEEGMLNVHIVPHTHDDVGWKKTVDQYYYGAESNIQKAGVQYILDSVVNELNKNPDRRFIYVEIAFFSRWWNEQKNSTRDLVRQLVNQGRLQFILGGWCMNDEATTHYTAIIDQHTAGFKFLQEHFGECGRPRVAWQIDPFGHSREQASIFAQFGMDALFFGRLDYQDRISRIIHKRMQMMWSGSDSLGDQAALMTGVNFRGYGPPAFFCFDANCNDPPFMDDPRLHDYNVDRKVNLFLDTVKEQAKVYKSDIMLTMGSDFQYSNAHKNFKQMDKMIKYVNARKLNGSKVNVFYSTPACYAYALSKRSFELTEKSDDFFPYANAGNAFWTGYFTSRPALKYYVRTTNNFFQACKQIHTLSQLRNTNKAMDKIDVLRDALAVAQHHDAVSGTETQAVAYDYAERLAVGVKQCQAVIQSAYTSMLSSGDVQLVFCPLINASVCDFSQTKSAFSVVVYNSLAQPRNHWMRIPVVDNKNTFVVKDANGNKLTSVAVQLSNETMNLPEHNGSASNAELLFRATNIPPLGFTTYQVSRTEGEFRKQTKQPRIFTGSETQTISNEYLEIGFSPTGFVSSLTNKELSRTIPLSQRPMYYQGHYSKAPRPEERQASGAYIFRPEHDDPTPISESPKLSIVKNELVEEARQVFSDWYSQVVRLYKGEKHAEFEWTVGPIPIKDGIGKEVISLFSTSLPSKSTFYTDANGRQFLKRIRNYRPTWEFINTQPVAGNYYPITSAIYIQDEVTKDMQFTVLNDRAQGGSSIKDGQIEVMVHRRLLHDDGKGVDEALNETGITGEGLVVRGVHYLMYDTILNSTKRIREMSQKIFAQPVITFGPPANGNDFNTAARMGSGLSNPSGLPANVRLLSLEQWDDSSVLLRLENTFELKEDPLYGKPVNVSLKNMFMNFEVTSAVELTLGANQELSKAERLQWNVENSGKTNGKISDFVVPVFGKDLTVTLKPMQIRTFRIEITKKTH